jgi:hypothetical protein
LTEGTAYVEAGRVELEKQVFVLSHYLTGKAHKFYIREVAGDPYSWGLQEFFLELFNSCFPVDFHTKQHRKLGEYLQRGRTVWEYVSELYELWNLIGDVGEHEKVTKLWNGFQYWIQSELWKDKLNPEKSSLREVIAAAEVIEIAHSVGGNNNKRTGEKGRQSGGGGATTGSSMSDGRKDDSRSNKGTNAASHGQSRDNKRQFRASQKGKHREGGNAKAGKELMKKLKLSEEDHDHAVVNKLCFGCKKPGHFVNNCPDGKTVARGSGNKPPGKVSSYSVWIASAFSKSLI